MTLSRSASVRPNGVGGNSCIAKSESSDISEASYRDQETQLLHKMVAVALDQGQPEPSEPDSLVEASLMRVSASVLSTRFPRESARLKIRSDRFVAGGHGCLLTPSELMARGALAGIPRWRDRLVALLERRLQMQQMLRVGMEGEGAG